MIILGFTLEARLVSSKHLTQVYLKISSCTLENLASHLMTMFLKFKQCLLKHFRSKISHTYQAMSQMRLFSSNIVKKCIQLQLQQHEGTNDIFCVSLLVMAQQGGFRQRNVTCPMLNKVVGGQRNDLVAILKQLVCILQNWCRKSDGLGSLYMKMKVQ